MYDGLFTVTSTFSVEPVLCDHYTVSDDLMTYTVTLLETACFTDGTPVSAADVVASYNAARGSAVYGSRLLYVYSVTAVDQRTVQFQLGTPYENLPLLLDIPIVAAVSVNDVQPMGTGPYYAAAQDGETVLLPNPHWWQEYKAAVTVESITLVETDSPAAIRDDFEYGATGVVCTDPAPRLTPIITAITSFGIAPRPLWILSALIRRAACSVTLGCGRPLRIW